ncbi:MAG: lysylphosphatidylglycerol synthase transmembrane domain-containing protein [Lacipirellulaceae bacterium]
MTPVGSIDGDHPRAAPAWRGRLLVALKLLLVAAVCWFVAGAARDAWADLATRRITLRPGLAVASGAVFLLSGLPMAWFWRKTLLALEQPAPLWPTVSAYFVSQIAKYVPGKGAVIVLRLARMRRFGGSLRTQAASVFYETLTVMAVGGVLAAGLVAVRQEAVGAAPSGWMAALALALGAGCALPTLPPVARWLVGRLAGGRQAAGGDPAGDDAAEQTAAATSKALARGLTWRLMAQGWLAATITWIGYGASLWLAAWSVGGPGPDGWGLATLWVLAAALPVVAGFLAMLPGGLVVREALGLELLSPALGPGVALATTIAVRLVWLAAEGAICVILIGVASMRRAGVLPHQQRP